MFGHKLLDTFLIMKILYEEDIRMSGLYSSFSQSVKMFFRDKNSTENILYIAFLYLLMSVFKYQNCKCFAQTYCTRMKVNKRLSTSI